MAVRHDCVVISALFCRNFLQGKVSGNAARDHGIIRETMLTGNSLYDKHGFTDLLLTDDVLEMESGIDLERSREAFVRPTELPSLVTMLTESGQASVSGRSAGIMIVAPLPFPFC